MFFACAWLNICSILRHSISVYSVFCNVISVVFHFFVTWLCLQNCIFNSVETFGLHHFVLNNSSFHIYLFITWNWSAALNMFCLMLHHWYFSLVICRLFSRQFPIFSAHIIFVLCHMYSESSQGTQAFALWTCNLIHRTSHQESNPQLVLS